MLRIVVRLPLLSLLLVLPQQHAEVEGVLESSSDVEGVLEASRGDGGVMEG